MSVFFVHDFNKRIVTPLARHYRIREIPEATGLEEIAPVASSTQKNPTLADEARQRKNAAGEYRHAEQAFQSPATNFIASLRLGKVRDIMSTNIVSASINDNLQTAWDEMQKHSIHHLAVMDDQQFLCGLVSDFDLSEILFSKPSLAPREITLAKLCKAETVSVGMEADIGPLGLYLLENSIDGLPVTENGKLMGIVTGTDILKLLLKTAPFDSVI